MDPGSNDEPNPKRLKTIAAGVKNRKGNTVLHQLVWDNCGTFPEKMWHKSTIDLVLRSVSDLPSLPLNALNDWGFTALHLAVITNNLPLIKKLFCFDALDVNTKTDVEKRKGDTALHIAARMGFVPIVEELLKANADVHIINNHNNTALCEATDVGIIELLLNAGADVNHYTTVCTSLHHVATKGNLEAVRLLVERGAHVNLYLLNGHPFFETVLNCAILRGNMDMIEFLASSGAEVDFPIEDRGNIMTPLECAIKCSNLEIIEFLRKHGAEWGAGDRAFLIAAMHSTPHILKYLMSFISDWSVKDDWVKKSLHRAAEYNNVATLEYLLSIGTDINAQDVFKKTPLHKAVCAHSLKVIEFLVEKGADVNAMDCGGMTPLRWSVTQNCYEIFNFLLNNAADVTVVSADGGTMLHEAASLGYTRWVRILIKRGCNVDAKDIYGWTPLHDAAIKGHVHVIRLLLDKGAYIYARNEDFSTPLDLAIDAKREDCVNLLKTYFNQWRLKA